MKWTVSVRRSVGSHFPFYRYIFRKVWLTSFGSKVTDNRACACVSNKYLFYPLSCIKTWIATRACSKNTSRFRLVSQFSSGLEEQMKSLMNTLGAIESQCQENRVWQEKQQQELELSIKQRDERRLQYLEEMQKQLVEYQVWS